ncbi:DUF2589 domain-containing protein [Flocculibacter collagenilyticus]|uniref:DUF2589 domain-containing protein n=1 Tax=Flocculibacter collagenilyticus TaxID=2744479 RepID=UPI0018F2DF7E|nr:DUF2589 domain-containing protein [Flocculibacter collagenilyticus]
MENDNDKSPIARQFSGLPLKALIGAPLKATADANGMMARSQTQFVLSTCFNQSDEEPDILSPVMVKFKMERQVVDESGQPSDSVAMNFTVPLMTLIPINSLAVEKLNVAFEMEVKSSTQCNSESSEDIKKAANQKVANDYKGQQFTSELHGTIASNSSTSSSAKYEVSIEAGQLPLPKGITAIIDVFTKGIAPMPTKHINKH